MPPALPSPTQVDWVDTLAKIHWPTDGQAIAIVDGALPPDLLDRLRAQPWEMAVVEAGERLKTLEAVGEMAQRVLAMRATRPLTLVGIGGGALGDAVGFLASILWRGVGLWHVPTTLLAMVDSAHGGKTAANLGGAKNQLGTFYPAQRVVVCAEILRALPTDLRREGLSELIKALWLGDEEGVRRLDHVAHRLGDAPLDQRITTELFWLLKRAVEVKYRVVAQDPFETKGIRTWLNFGHTLAHALELEFDLSHGVAVAWGMHVAAGLSVTHAGLPSSQAERLKHHLDPLLRPWPGGARSFAPERFEALVRRDKKRQHGKLRSVLLGGVAQPVVTTAITASMWHDAMVKAYDTWLSTPLCLHWHSPHTSAPTLAASKSGLNRAQAIAHLRPGDTTIQGDSQAEDVLHLRRALHTLSSGHVHVGAGGTTYRFALIAALCAPTPTRLLANPSLLSRPHAPLYEALHQLGATLDLSLAPQGQVTLTPPRSLPPHPVLHIRCDASSQYASALAMLAASGLRLTVCLTTDADGGFDPEAFVSRAYFEMTLRLLTQAGVSVAWDLPSGRVELSPTPRLHEHTTLCIPQDESSAAFWRAAAGVLGLEVEMGEWEADPLQADHMLVALLPGFGPGGKGHDTPVTIDLQQAPDLAPVLTALGVSIPHAVTLCGAAHLKHKESDRIHHLTQAFAAVGILVHPRPDGLHIPAGIQHHRPGARFSPHGDHRLAFAAALLALASGQPLWIEDPWVVAKSYPAFWSHVRGGGGVLGHGP